MTTFYPRLSAPNTGGTGGGTDGGLYASRSSLELVICQRTRITRESSAPFLGKTLRAVRGYGARRALSSSLSDWLGEATIQECGRGSQGHLRGVSESERSESPFGQFREETRMCIILSQSLHSKKHDHFHIKRPLMTSYWHLLVPSAIPNEYSGYRDTSARDHFDPWP